MPYYTRPCDNDFLLLFLSVCLVSPPTCFVQDLMSRCDSLQHSSSFLRCAHLVAPEAFAALCEEDACHCGADEACRCQAMLEYARTCASHGIALHSWPGESQCVPKCPVGMQYSECASPCFPTCQSLNIHEVCKEDCADGCTCPAGKVLDGTRCVDVSQCSCMHAGRRYPPGSSIPQDCNTWWAAVLPEKNEDTLTLNPIQ
ncbi:hypothetical protein Z043_123408 [Scleropages formosus]|uniref:VWF/SSPO/Zonadhesin-like cysteine-rich domain-containing protein n=1 Tax=Scleropages formosus TaxID=113540 RepID=A0A0P7WC55_SCLFO|nr:hypothetical protein Z043_123408 [Scleropages formosus]